MGPVQDWGRKSIVICRGTQYMLEHVSAWESLGKFKEVKRVLKHAAEVGQRMYDNCNSDIHNKWMEMEGGEIVEVEIEQLQNCGAELANNFAQGIAVQELNKNMTVVREEYEEEIRDMLYISGALVGKYFAMPRKDKGKERAREVSPSLALKRKSHSQGGLSLDVLTEGLKEDMWEADGGSKGKATVQTMSWGPGQLGPKGSFDEIGNEAGDLGSRKGGAHFCTLGPNRERKGSFRPGIPLPTRPLRREDDNPYMEVETS